ncbi:MAG: ABC transporter substrate-binding protein [Microscillaceae bacterium]|nr:ABC transporter substrate-binding protein [Microscillaceae bacterium]
MKKKTAKVTIRYAQTFRVEYFENYKLLTLLNPQQPTAPAQQFVLLPRGTAAPAGFASEQIVEIPIRRLIPLSHTHIACAMVLGVDSTIVAVNEAEYLPEEKILQKIAQRTIQNLGSGAELNSELVLSLRPDLIMTGGGADMKPYQAFLKAGIKVIPNADWLENSPLGRAESIKLLALFYDQEAQAEAKFRDIEAKYLSIKNLAKRATTRPQVLCDIPYKTTWYVPGGQSFFAQLLADARAKYHWHHTTSTASLPIDFEAVYPVALQSDYWLNLSVYKTKAEVLAQDRRFAAFKAFKNGQLYNNNRQATTKGGNTYYMWGIVNPDLILSDLVKIFHPELLPDYQLIYYQKIE